MATEFFKHTLDYEGETLTVYAKAVSTDFEAYLLILSVNRKNEHWIDLHRSMLLDRIMLETKRY